jgi:hypothetical protein
VNALVTLAVAAHLVSLPSPLAPLTGSPPLDGGAHSSGEGVPHRVASTVRVTVAVDRTGSPFAIRAAQRLDVRRVGDYTFSISAPVTRVEAGPGSDSTPGQRAGAILWAGFAPGPRTLASTAELELAAADSLPLAVEVAGGRLTLRNRTAVTTTTFDADAQPTELLATLAGFRRAVATGAPPTGGTALVTSPVRPVRIQVSAPLSVAGTIGARKVDLVLGGVAHPLSATFPAGPVRLSVRPRPARELLQPSPGESGRALLARAIRASLELARARQYDTFLGNPDPVGSSRTTYVYLTAQRGAAAPVVADTGRNGRDWWQTVLWIVGGVAALGVGAVVWSRS